MPDYLTIREISKRVDEEEYIVRYALRTYGPPAAGKFGITNVWREADLPAIRKAIKQTAANSTSRERREAAV